MEHLRGAFPGRGAFRLLPIDSLGRVVEALEAGLPRRSDHPGADDEAKRPDAAVLVELLLRSAGTGER